MQEITQENDFLAVLNPAQRQAVEKLNGPLLVLAGAGSGKTRVLTYRMAHLILQGEATPGEIFAVTFTNKAAKEMSHRIVALLQTMNVPVYEPLWISTFHSSCARILREDIHHLGYQPFFVIYDDGDQLSLLKRICEDLNLNDKVYPPKGFRHQISQAKMLGLNPDRIGQSNFFRMDDTTIEVYRIYEDEMRRSNALDFDDLLLKTYELLSQHPTVLQQYRERFKYIMVDEYQDTNHIQYLIIKLLAEEHRNLCVVGDEDQSIYSWRGADIKNILDFEKDFPETATVKLEENYRSTKNIVDAASKVIAQNKMRKGKTLFTQNTEGSKIVLQCENNEYDEAQFITRKIQDLLRTGLYKLNDIAVFYRTNAQSRVLEEQLRSYSVPYRIVGTVKFYERKEIKDIICYMRLLLNPQDDVAFYRIVNVPARGLGKSTIETIMQYASEHKITSLEAAQKVAETRLVHAGACNKLQNFRFMIDTLRSDTQGTLPSETYLKILERTGYADKLKEEKTPESDARIENLQEFQNAILQFEDERGAEATLQAFLEEMALISDADQMDENADAVTLMTLHLSKGLEFKNVFMTGLEEGLFPSGRSLEGKNPDDVEEERRICYVGMTRARENLYMSFAKSRRVWGQEEFRPPSRFLKEIPAEYCAGNYSPLGYGGTYSGANPSGEPRSETASYLDRLKEQFSKKNVFPDYEEEYAQPNPGTNRYHNPQNAEDDFAESGFDENPSPNAHFERGDRVRHPIFGVGSILQIEGSGDQQKVSILFRDKSLKKFIVKHARIEKV